MLTADFRNERKCVFIITPGQLRNPEVISYFLMNQFKYGKLSFVGVEIDQHFTWADSEGGQGVQTRACFMSKTLITGRATHKGGFPSESLVIICNYCI